MTVKQFFKSTAFKCIITLLCVLLISGIFLTIAYGLLEVTEDEKFNRKVGNLYTDGAQVTTHNEEIEPVKVGTSTVEKLWYIKEKNDYLVQISGSGRDGKIVTWVIVEINSDKTIKGVGTVLVFDKVSSEYADKIPGWNTNIENFSKDYTDGIVYKYGTKGDSMYINTGASVSFTAICGCVNDAIKFVSAYASGGSVSESPLDKFLYNELINKDETTVSFVDGKLTYTIKTLAYGASDPFTVTVTLNGEKKIESFEFGDNGNGATDGYDAFMPKVENIFKDKDLSYFTGLYGADMEYKAIASYDDTGVTTGASTETIASNSTYLCMYAGAFATANYDNALKLGIKYTDLIDMDATTWTVDNGKVTCTIKTLAYGASDPFTVTVTLNGEKKIESFEFGDNGNGATDGYDAFMPKVENIFKGKDLSYFTGLYGTDMEYKAIASYDDTDVTTGASTETIASNSTYLCMYAGAFATANYDLITLIGGGANE